jgi:hypothetical protein
MLTIFYTIGSLSFHHIELQPQGKTHTPGIDTYKGDDKIT